MAKKENEENRLYPALIKPLEKILQKKEATGALILISIDNYAMLLHGCSEKKRSTMLSALLKKLAGKVQGQGEVVPLQPNHYGVILNGISTNSSFQAAQDIYNVIQTFGVEEQESMHILVSIGYAEFPRDATTPQALIDRAFIALSRSKRNIGRHYCDYPTALELYAGAEEKMIKATKLKSALQNDNLRLAFQPIVSSKTGKVLCYECLLRMIDKEGNIISAGPYVEIAEEMGFIDEVDFAVFHMALEELEKDSDVMLGLNVSNQTIDNPLWLKKVEKELSDPSIASRIIIEITETAVQKDLRRAAYFVAALQGIGCQVALDDFGAGYTSFRQLKTLPVDIVKIDGSFIKNMVENVENQLFVKTLLDFTNSFGLKTIAEFVETGEIAKSLMELKVDYLQGHYFSPPVNYRPWLNEDEQQAGKG